MRICRTHSRIPLLHCILTWYTIRIRLHFIVKICHLFILRLMTTTIICLIMCADVSMYNVFDHKVMINFDWPADWLWLMEWLNERSSSFQYITSLFGIIKSDYTVAAHGLGWWVASIVLELLCRVSGGWRKRDVTSFSRQTVSRWTNKCRDFCGPGTQRHYRCKTTGVSQWRTFTLDYGRTKVDTTTRPCPNWPSRWPPPQLPAWTATHARTCTNASTHANKKAIKRMHGRGCIVGCQKYACGVRARARLIDCVRECVNKANGTLTKN